MSGSWCHHSRSRRSINTSKNRTTAEDEDIYELSSDDENIIPSTPSSISSATEVMDSEEKSTDDSCSITSWSSTASPSQKILEGWIPPTRTSNFNCLSMYPTQPMCCLNVPSCRMMIDSLNVRVGEIEKYINQKSGDHTENSGDGGESTFSPKSSTSSRKKRKRRNTGRPKRKAALRTITYKQ
jgi:hypothetical protein